MGKKYPGAVVALLELETPPEAVAALPRDPSPYTVDLFQCLTTAEQLEMAVHLVTELGAYVLVGKELMAVFSEEEITCFTESFGITREQLAALMEQNEAGTPSSAATKCFTAATFGRMFAAMLSAQVGGLDEDSASCIEAFAVAHPHFLVLVSTGLLDPSAIGQDEAVELAGDGLRLLQCLSDDALRALENLAAHALTTPADHLR